MKSHLLKIAVSALLSGLAFGQSPPKLGDGVLHVRSHAEPKPSGSRQLWGQEPRLVAYNVRRNGSYRMGIHLLAAFVIRQPSVALVLSAGYESHPRNPSETHRQR